MNILIITISVIVMLTTPLIYWAGHNVDSDFGHFMKKICIFDFAVALLAFIYVLVRMIFKI